MKAGNVLLCVLCLIAVLTVSVFSNERTDDPIGVAVSPQTLILDSDQGSVSVHTDIPFSTVVPGSVALNGIAPISVGADARGCLVAKFGEVAVKAIAAPPETVFTLTGETTDGGTFSGSDTVRVIYQD